MAIALGQPVNEITHGLEGIKIDGQVRAVERTGNSELQHSSGWPAMDVANVQALPQEGRGDPVEQPSIEMVHPCVEQTGVEYAQPGVDHITFATTEQFPYHPYSAIPNSFIPFQGPTYTGYPAPIVNFHGYVPYSRDFIYHNPVVEYNHVYNQDFNCSPSCTRAPIDFGYGQQTYAYPQYQIAPVDQCNGAAPLANDEHMMMPEVQDPGSFIPYGYQYMHPNVGYPQFVSVAVVEQPDGGFNVVHYVDTRSPSVLNEAPPAWIQQAAKPKGLIEEDVHVQLKPGCQQPSKSANFGHLGNQNVHNSSSERAETKMRTFDGKRQGRKQFGPPYNSNMPVKGAWVQAGPWQCMNVGNPLKALSGKNKGPTEDKCVGSAQPPMAENFAKLEFNLASFSTEFEDAKHFIIKSFSEENVYRSIQYGVWASTPNGNKKLDEAYQDAQCGTAGKAKGCPVFLYFSVNGSGRFCGVAEMSGPVDFCNTMDFWERNRWCGSFPVKWHFIKDVPHCQLRRIILQNNENKPVTSSRDTQEVNFEQGLQMLTVIKNYSTKASILDNFPSLSAQQKVVADAKVVQPTLESSDQVDARVPQELNVSVVPESSKALRACNSEANARENYSQQGKDIYGKGETLFQNYTGENTGGRDLDKENVIISDVNTLAIGC